MCEQDHDTDDKANITYAVRNKGLYRGSGRCGSILGRFGALVDPETDQQVGTQAHQFPSDKDHQEVLGKNDIEHGEGEEREIREETRVARRVLHIALRVELHQQGDGGDDH